MLSNFESHHLGPGYIRKRHSECVEPSMGLSWRMPSITGTAAVEAAAGGKQPWLVIKATTHLGVLRLISC